MNQINGMPVKFLQEKINKEGQETKLLEVAICFFKGKYIELRRGNWKELYKTVIWHSRQK